MMSPSESNKALFNPIALATTRRIGRARFLLTVLQRGKGKGRPKLATTNQGGAAAASKGKHVFYPRRGALKEFLEICALTVEAWKALVIASPLRMQVCCTDSIFDPLFNSFAKLDFACTLSVSWNSAWTVSRGRGMHDKSLKGMTKVARPRKFFWHGHEKAV